MKHTKLIVVILFAIFINKTHSQSYQDAVLPKQNLNKGSELSSGEDLSTGVISPSIPLVTLPGRKSSASVNLVYIGGQGLRQNIVASRVGWGWDLEFGGKIEREVKGIRDEKIFNSTVYQTDANNQSGWLDQTTHSINHHISHVFTYSITYVPHGAIQNIDERCTVDGVDCDCSLINFSSLNLISDINNTQFCGPSSASTICGDHILTYQLGSQTTGLKTSDMVDYYKNQNPQNNIPAEIWKLEQKKYFFNSWSNNQYGEKQFDTEPDVFTFKFGNYFGQFVFDKNGYPVIFPFQDIKIEPAIGPLATGTSWIFTTPDGYKYIFSETERTLVSHSYTWNQSSDSHESISAWYLSSIIDPLGAEITFSYNTAGDEQTLTKGAMLPKFIVGSRIDIYKDCNNNNCEYPTDNPSVYITTKEKKEISRISSDYGHIEFISDQSNHRLDEYREVQQTTNNFYALKYIKQYDYNGICNKIFEFNYDYFGNPTQSGSWPGQHLRLLNLKQLPNDFSQNQLIYSFNYELFDNTISNADRYWLLDKWGFFNNDNTGTPISNTCTNLCNSMPIGQKSLILKENGFLDGSDRLPSLVYTKEGVLNQIKTPSGAEINYEYELNDFFNSSTGLNENWGGLRIKRIIEKPNGSTSTTPTTKEYNYSREGLTSQSSGEIVQLRRQYDENDYFNSNGNFVGKYLSRYSNANRDNSKDFIRYTHVEVVSPGNGKKTFDFTGYYSNPDLLTERWNFNSNSNSWTQYFSDKDNDAGVPNIDQSLQRGKLLKEQIFIEPPTGFSGSVDELKISETNYEYEYSPIGFANVNVLASRVNCDQKLYQTGSNVNSVNSFNIEYYYHSTNWIYLKKITNKRFAQNGNLYNLNKVQNDDTRYVYNPNHPSQISKVIRINSDNIITSTNYIYPSDLIDNLSLSVNSDQAAALRKMIELNQISLPIETFVCDETDPLHPLIIKSVFVQYRNYGNSFWNKPMCLQEKIFINRYKVPSANFSPVHFSNNGSSISLVKDINYKLDYLYDEYDTYGNLLREHKYKSTVKSHLWGYPNRILPVANYLGNKNENKTSVAGCPYSNLGNECSYVGFESILQPNENDFWDYIINPSRTVITSDDAHTGTKCQMILQASNQTPYVNPTPGSTTNLSNMRVAQFSFSAARAFLPDDQTRTYNFNAWIKTSANYTSNQAWIVMDVQHKDGTEIIDASNNNVGYHYFAIPNTTSNWSKFQVSVNLEAFRNQYASLLSVNDDKLILLCYIVNYDRTSYNYVLVDDIRFNSVEGQGASFTYDKSYQNSSVSDINNIPTFFFYDSYNRLEASENFKNEVLSYTQFYNTNIFSITSPNFEKNFIPLTPITLSNIRSGNYNNEDVVVTTNYMDGLNRILQSNISNYFSDQSGNKYSLIQPYVYDEYGRSEINYLPYVNSASINYDQNFLTNQSSFYSNGDKIAHDIKPHSEIIFEQSPSSIIKEISPQGNNWVFSTNHTIKKSFSFNDNNEVRLWKINRNSSDDYSGASILGVFQENTLLKSISTDEENHTFYEFYDLQGKIICKKFTAYTNILDETLDFSNGLIINSGGSEKLYCIYYVYDEFNQLVYTLPIQNDLNQSITSFVDNAGLSDPIFKGRINANHYDVFGRVIAKHVCDGDWDYLAYNADGKPVLFQNAKLRVTGDWIVSKYDAIGRTCLTGIKNLGNLNLSSIQTNIDNDLSTYIKSTAVDPSGYTISNTYPFSIDRIHITNFYDKYNTSDPILTGRIYSPFDAIDPSTNSENLTGKLTGTKTNILQSTNYLYVANFYDDYGRLIQQHKQNLLDYPNSWDVLYVQQSFDGRINKTIQKHSAFNSITLIKTRNLYDKVGRLTDKFKQVNNEPEVYLNKNEYNSLGQLTRKILHNQTIGARPFLQGIDYRYNIRGWLTSINNSILANDGQLNIDDNDVFGEQLYYESPVISNSNFNCVPYYNGNISQITWRTKPVAGLVSYDLRPIHTYTYRYDDFGRLVAGYYATNSETNPVTFDQNINTYLEKEKYDLHGNIKALLRNSEKGTPIDDLSYNYELNSNKLNAIEDNVSGNPEVSDYHNNVSIANEYTFDASGNLILDRNKNLSITYNFLNLAEVISGQGTLQNTYDAAGNKLASIIDGVLHTYVNGIEYEGNNLKFINTEEGRIRKSDDYSLTPIDYVYDYFIKDHLGSIRVTLTTGPRENDYFATMEPQNSVIENQLFYNITSSMENKLPGYPTDNSYSPDQKASGVSTVNNKTIGNAKVLSVNGDDIVNLNTKYYFSNTVPVGQAPLLQDILSQLATTFVLNPSNGYSIAGSEQALRDDWANQTFLANPELNNFLTTSFDQNDLNNPGEPRAYMVWLFFTKKDFRFIPEASGLMQATNANQLGELGMLNLKMPENGFLYVYVSNHSIQKVDFDHLSIIHQQGRLLEENHYYPYGMLIEGLSYISNRNNPSKYKFNGISYETSNDLYNYMAPFRSYDPSIAKWNQLDPMNQFENGYIAFGGNPVLLVDPLGLSANYGSSKSDFASMDAISQMRDNKGKNGGGPGNWFTGGDGFLSADGTRYSSEELRSFFENMRFYNSLPDEVKDELGTGAAGFAGGIHNGDISVDSYSYEPVVAHFSQYKQGDFVSQMTFSGYDYGWVHRTSGNVVDQGGGDFENGVDWGMVGNGAITTVGGGLLWSGGIAISTTGVGALWGIPGIMLGSAAMGFGTAMMVAGFSGKNVNIPGGLGEAFDKGFGGSGTIGQILDIGSGGLPKNLLDAGLTGYGLFNSNLGQMMLFGHLNINNGSSNPFVAPRDNTNVVLPFRRP